MVDSGEEGEGQPAGKRQRPNPAPPARDAPSMTPPGARPSPAALTSAEEANPLPGLDYGAPSTLLRDCRFLLGTLRTSQVQAQLFAARVPPRDAAPRLICPGVVLLPGFLSLAASHEAIATVDGLAATTPFRIPRVNNAFSGAPAWANLYMLFCGMVWDGLGAAKGYSRMAPKEVPQGLLRLARAALQQASALGGFAEHLPGEADYGRAELWTGIVNFYPSRWGTISPHSDTSEPSLAADSPGGGRFYPVVSFSVGNAAEFLLWPDWTSADPGERLVVELQSGDALVFGGPRGRLIRHGIEKTCRGGIRPPGLHMVEGRMNITIRRL